MKITATVITRNEERNISETLKSLEWADEVVVVDSESTDKTVDIARRLTSRVIVRPWPGYAAQKNFAAEQASNDWILSLDADERISPELRTSIEALQRVGPEQAAYQMPRRSWYIDRWVKHSGWYPDYKVRLYDRRRARWQGEYVHESVSVNGSTGTLHGDLLHYTVMTLDEHHQRLGRYTTLAAEEMRARGQRPGMLSLLLAPPATFLKSYLLKFGFLDGRAGLMIAGFAAYYVFLRNAKAR